MDERVGEQSFAWQPLTPRGVAKFAHASFGRVQLVQLIVALLAAASVLWFVGKDWFPIVRSAIGRLPEQGEIRGGRLDLNGDWPAALAENRFIAFTVDPEHAGEVRSPAHLSLELGRRDVLVFSILGFAQQPYSKKWVVPLNRTELIPWWGAWAPPILAALAVGVITGLLVSWICLATLYSPVAWLIGFFANRDLSLGGSWRLAGAALMPGALLLTGTIVAYGLGWLDLVRLAVAMAVHFVVGWFYLVAGALAVPRLPSYAKLQSNPFAAPPASQPAADEKPADD